MNGIDLMNNLIDELNRARDFINEYYEYHSDSNECESLLDDINNDLERYYDYSDSFNAMLADIIIQEG